MPFFQQDGSNDKFVGGLTNLHLLSGCLMHFERAIKMWWLRFKLLLEMDHEVADFFDGLGVD